jgi:tellurite resistance protein
MSTDAHAPLKYLYPGWFACVMGLSGLALAWHAAQPLLGAMAGALALVAGAVAAAAFVALALASGWRVLRHPQAWAADLRHPVRHAFVAALPISMLLLATVGVALFGPGPALGGLWGLGAIGQLGVTLWVLARWWRPGGLVWAGLTPALFIPVVGNVLLPLAGLPLGQGAWAAAQFGIGLLFWPVVLVLVIVRLAQVGPWPERMAPLAFIVIAPPAVIGLVALQFGAPPPLVWMLWGMAAFSALWAGALLRRIAQLPFGLPHWGLSFPLAALTALTLALAAGDAPAGLEPLALALLALSSLLVLALSAATLRGLRQGSLLVPEPVAALQPVTGDGAAVAAGAGGASGAGVAPPTAAGSGAGR